VRPKEGERTFGTGFGRQDRRPIHTSETDCPERRQGDTKGWTREDRGTQMEQREGVKRGGEADAEFVTWTCGKTRKEKVGTSPAAPPCREKVPTNLCMNLQNSKNIV